MCTKPPATVDLETDQRTTYVEELKKSFKSFNLALTATVDAYRQLLVSFNSVAESYSSLALNCDDSARMPVANFHKSIQELRATGPFVAFDSELHSGTIAVMDPLREELKRVEKTMSGVASKKKDYDAVRYKLEQKEKEYAKKNKPLTESEAYKKDQAKREKAKVTYEARREALAIEVRNLQTNVQSVLISSMNSYLRSTATFSGCIENIMNCLRTDDTRTAERSHMGIHKERSASYAKSPNDSVRAGSRA